MVSATLPSAVFPRAAYGEIRATRAPVALWRGSAQHSQWTCWAEGHRSPAERVACHAPADRRGRRQCEVCQSQQSQPEPPCDRLRRDGASSLRSPSGSRILRGPCQIATVTPARCPVLHRCSMASADPMMADRGVSRARVVAWRRDHRRHPMALRETRQSSLAQLCARAKRRLDRSVSREHRSRGSRARRCRVARRSSTGACCVARAIRLPRKSLTRAPSGCSGGGVSG